MVSLAVIAALLVGCDRVPAPAAAPASRPDFTGLWKVADTELQVKPEDDASVLTDEAQRRRQFFTATYGDPEHDPSSYCLAHGMPWNMVSRARDYLMDIYQTSDRVTILLEGMDAHRLIRLDQTSVPEGFSPGTNGYSLAHWEGDTLVIETTALRPANEVGMLQRSDQMRVVERWRLIQHPVHGRALEMELQVIDPVVYRRPARGYALYVPAPPGSVLNAYGCNESMWDDRVAEWERQRKERGR
jgi:hypothetical protein